MNKRFIQASVLGFSLLLTGPQIMGQVLADVGTYRLPVEKEAPPSKIEFEAHRVDQNVELRWVVSGFVKMFSVERSLDGETWDPILRMTGSNQTYNKTEYFDIDYDVPSVKLFYRVTHVLYSGESSTSNTAFVPAFDERTFSEERLIKTISDPIQVGMKIDLYFVNFEEEDLLLVLRDQCNVEFFAKVKYVKEEGSYVVTDVSGDIPSGQYLITASNKKRVYSSKLRIELQ